MPAYLLEGPTRPTPNTSANLITSPFVTGASMTSGAGTGTSRAQDR
jgi:hypothetical protein